MDMVAGYQTATLELQWLETNGDQQRVRAFPTLCRRIIFRIVKQTGCKQNYIWWFGLAASNAPGCFLAPAFVVH